MSGCFYLALFVRCTMLLHVAVALSFYCCMECHHRILPSVTTDGHLGWLLCWFITNNAIWNVLAFWYIYAHIFARPVSRSRIVGSSVCLCSHIVHSVGFPVWFISSNSIGAFSTPHLNNCLYSQPF